MDVMMIADSGTQGKQKVDVHYVNAGVPYLIEENFEDYYLDNGAYLLADVIQDQETLYQSLQGIRLNDGFKASSSTHPRSDHDCGQSSGSTSVGNPSRSMNYESQLAMDEALARELQYEEDGLAATSLSETTATSTEASPSPANDVTTTVGSSALATRQDYVDPDNMSYEELQSLGEAIGTESKGLSDEHISVLRYSTYKTGFFSRKDKEECVICCMSYKNRDLLITLPCKHHYHSDCVKQWLKINKVCPICNAEVAFRS
uniref:E3 ubiquitin ligase BIG BROTHER n=2 Tax=Anthurium amnicola TaxID=1678845 RepID=A0A1D1Z1E1_9ARAE